MRRLLLIILLLPLSAKTADWYASPSGVATNSGSSSSPWDLQTALLATNDVSPGDTIFLLPGTFGNGGTNRYTSRLEGATNNAITIKPSSFSDTVVDGGILAYGSWVTWQGFEIINSDTTRTNTADNRPPGLYLLGAGHKCINLCINNTGHPGIGFWDDVGPDGEVYGCVIYGVGLYSLDAGWGGAPRGSGIYAQNQYGERFIENCILFKNWTYGAKPYGEGGYVNGFNVDGCWMFFNYSGFAIDSLTYTIDSFALRDSVLYENSNTTFGWNGATTFGTLVLSNNIMVRTVPQSYISVFQSKYWTNMLMGGNTMVVRTDNATYRNNAQFWNIFTTNGTYSLDGDGYYGGNTDNVRLNDVKQGIDDIQSSPGWELSATEVPTNTPSANVVLIETNKYEVGRLNIAIFNWETNDVEVVDLTGYGLSHRQSYRIRDVQNYHSASYGVFDTNSPSISLSLTNTTIEPLVGTQTHFSFDPDTTPTSPTLTVYLLEPLGFSRQARATTATVGTITGP